MLHFELALAYEVFGSVPAGLSGRWYDVRVCGTHAVRVGRFLLEPDCGLDRLAHAETVIVPALADVDEDPPADLVEAVRAAHESGARVVSLCTGAFVLAAAGLLDGLRATTHWAHTEELAARYPRVKVDPDVLYVDNGSVLTSAGKAAAMDLCLHLVRRDLARRSPTWSPAGWSCRPTELVARPSSLPHRCPPRTSIPLPSCSPG
jgi:AraC family transcriptional activator FtrA